MFANRRGAKLPVRFLAALALAPLALGSSIAIAAPADPPKPFTNEDSQVAGSTPPSSDVDDTESDDQGGEWVDEGFGEDASGEQPGSSTSDPEGGTLDEEEVEELEPASRSETAAPTQLMVEDDEEEAENVAGRCDIPVADYTGNISGATRLGGATRYATNVAIARAVASEAQGPTRAVFVANASDFADGLAVGALAAYSGWPLFLVGKNNVDSQVSAEIRNVNPTHIYIAGGTGVVSNNVMNALEGMGTPDVTVTRLAGADRYETSAKIAGCFPVGSPAFVVTGGNFADAVVAGPAAAAQNGAVILTPTGKIGEQTSRALSDVAPSRINIVGGKWSTSVRNQMSAAAGGASTHVYAGADRYATSASVADAFFASAKNVAYASGGNFPDSLSGVAVAKTIGGPIVLTRKDCRPSGVTAVANRLNGARVLLGGTGVVNTTSYSKACTSSTPKPAPAPTRTIPDIARSLVGTKAASGGMATNPVYGFDCSGLTQYVYKQAGKNIPRNTYGQWSAGRSVPQSAAKPGDLVVMRGGAHIAIYMGNNMIVDSPGVNGRVVMHRPIWGPVTAFVTYT